MPHDLWANCQPSAKVNRFPHWLPTFWILAHWLGGVCASRAKKKVRSKAMHVPTLAPLVSSLSLHQPKPPPTKDNEVALPHLESVTNLTKLCREFSRCLRPSLSSKRPLRVSPGCQASPAVKQPQRDFQVSIPALDEVYQTLAVSSLDPKGTPRKNEQSDSLSLKSTDSTLAPCVQAYRDSNIAAFPLPLTLPDL